MRVKKRDGSFEPVSFDKITRRFERFDIKDVNVQLIAQKVIQGIYDGVSTVDLDNLGAETAAYMSTIHPNYEKMAVCIAVSNLHKETSEDFENLYQYMDPEISKIFFDWKDLIQSQMRFDRDYEYTYFGFKTLLNGKYLFPEERPQHMLMRVSIGMHKNNLSEAFKTYDLLSRRIYTHGSPTLFNSGTVNPQCASCFLLSMDDDSIEGIYNTVKKCALISKGAGGIGFNIHNIRSFGSFIKGTNGKSNGVPPMLRVFNATARYVDQGGGKRKGAFAVYVEPWHADIFEILELKKNTGPDELRARDLFYGLWIPDLFMKRVEEDGIWSLMCPHECPGLFDVYGEAFEVLYQKYESEKRYKRQIKAQELWFAILELQIETGVPYMLYKDACNRKSNQNNLGTIRNSNLCTEIVQFTSPSEIAVCNLASVALNMFVKDGKYSFDALYDAVCQIVRNLNQIIDISKYPTKEAKYSNLKHRPIGIGVQGLADTFFLMRFPFDSLEAAELNKKIFETIYFAACTESMELAKVHGPYESFHGSLASKGILQFDLWDYKCPRFDELKKSIMKYGMRNSLLVAPMPTASTSQILGNTECFEPISSNIFVRNTLSGSFVMVNQYLVSDLEKLNMWNESMKNEIILQKGSIQNILSIPKDIRDLYKTVWEIKQRVIVDMSADRAVFIDQSQSLNIHMADPTFEKLTSLHFHGWKKGLKTGMYYLRSRPAVDAIQFTVTKPSSETVVCSRDNRDCISCSS